MLFDLLCLALGLIIGFGTAWFALRARQMAGAEQAEENCFALERRLNAVLIENARVTEHLRLLEQESKKLSEDLAQERQFNISLHAELTRERTSRNHLEQRIEHQKSDLMNLQERMGRELKELFHKVLEEKAQSLSDVNQASLNLLLQPLFEKFQEFNQRIEEQHYRETKELIVLHNKLSNLESKRGAQVNGAGPSAPASAASALDEERNDHSSLGYIEFIPPQEDGLSAEPESDQLITVTRVEEEPELDSFHAFTPKQEVEIDNFLKRTLGRPAGRKAGSATNTLNHKVASD